MMRHLQTFHVYPNIPEPLSFLETLSRNIWWSWQYDAVDLFHRINPRLWDECGRNPIKFLTYIPQKRLEELAGDVSFLSHQDRVRERFEQNSLSDAPDYLSRFTPEETVAYFSMEFGIHESIPLFAGGLGILAGDHLKAASDIGIPLVGVGLMYRQGYFRQYLDQDGWQQEEYPDTDIYQLPVSRVRNTKGDEIRVSVKGPDGIIKAAVWKLSVGNVPLFLLDTNIEENPVEFRGITSRLYVGDQRERIRQEMVLGIGGMRALKALGISPAVIHMNEGHSAFSSLERLAQVMEDVKVDLPTALEIVPRSTVFTTHTPVPAGNEEFPVEMIRPYLIPFEERLKTTADEILSWGQPPGNGLGSHVSMFVLGAHMAQYCNGVSELHGRVARGMWKHLWPDVPEDEIPISHVTNGVHITSFISHEIAQLFDRYIGPSWQGRPSAYENVKRIDDIYDEELWRAHAMSRARLIRNCRKMMVKQYRRRNAPRDILKRAELVLDQDVLTIAFARRFATYKRAYLLFQDPDRLEAILSSKTNPVQFVFAGKAHPRDHEGKELIRRIIHFARRPGVRDRIIFIENYDINVARHLVQGADIWLNTPRRPLEACGTSGMKAAINGVLNVSILDGWWCEGYAEDRGWRIGNGEDYSDHDFQDAVESQALYNVLEDEVIPAFYDRRNGDIPSRWIQMMKASMKMSIQTFCSQRMVDEYHFRFYEPAAGRRSQLAADGAAEAAVLSEQRKRLEKLWEKVSIDYPEQQNDGPFRVGDAFRVTAVVNLGELRPDDVDVELYFGVLRSLNDIIHSDVQPMNMLEAHGGGLYLYSCDVTCRVSGRYGYTARVTPRGDIRMRFMPGFITWV